MIVTWAPPTLNRMKGTFAVLWAFQGRVHSGSLEVLADRLLLTTRGRTMAVPTAAIRRFAIERGPAARLSGLAVLSLELVDHEVIRLASLQGTALLHDLAGRLAPATAAV
jgi:hypothetical protein